MYKIQYKSNHNKIQFKNLKVKIFQTKIKYEINQKDQASTLKIKIKKIYKIIRM